MWYYLPWGRRNQFKLLLLLMFVASIAEMFTISAVLPLLGVLANPELVFDNPYVKPVNGFLKITSPDQLRLRITIGFITIALFAGAIRILLLVLSTRLLFAAGIDLSAYIYRHSLHQPYPVHVERNSSDLINVVFNKCSDVIYGVMTPITNIISSVILLIGITTVLLIINPLVMLVTFAFFGLLYYFILRVLSQKLKRNSRLIARESTNSIKCLQEGIGGIRDVLLANSQDYYFSIYKTAISKLRYAQRDNSIMGATPRFIIETMGIVLIASLALYLTGMPGGITSAIPILGALAIGAQRALPTLQLLYSSIATIKGVQFSLKDVLNLLDQPTIQLVKNEVGTPAILKNKFSLEKVSFKYASNLPYALNDISIDICKGDRIGVVGATGGGKTTLIDLIMGLLTPSEGALIFDGEILSGANINSWQSCISHVPQNIYLADTSIEQNIAFGVEKSEIDSERVLQACEIAQLSQTILNLPQKYQTRIGENGVMLSGGQRQRLGIARALYRKSSLIIFDEATSALDSDTEKKVMDGIDNLSETRTILMIAHRVSTLRNCNKIFKIESGLLDSVTSYKELSQ